MSNTSRRTRIRVQALCVNWLPTCLTGSVGSCIKGAKYSVDIVEQLFTLLKIGIELFRHDLNVAVHSFPPSTPLPQEEKY